MKGGKGEGKRGEMMSEGKKEGHVDALEKRGTTRIDERK